MIIYCIWIWKFTLVVGIDKVFESRYNKCRKKNISLGMQFQKPLYFREFLLVTGNSYHYNSTKEMNHSPASYVAI